MTRSVNCVTMLLALLAVLFLTGIALAECTCLGTFKVYTCDGAVAFDWDATDSSLVDGYKLVCTERVTNIEKIETFTDTTGIVLRPRTGIWTFKINAFRIKNGEPLESEYHQGDMLIYWIMEQHTQEVK